ncbi:hypothetical protein [Zhihengliuella halotolerans]|uniref:hypothetical protein n=1 Tax=Zhihengliuella halotolerans TaxID=370736 RepID=UPI000C80E92A|nr:hypothetical protein [Zhihengliuella halotolerans]
MKIRQLVTLAAAAAAALLLASCAGPDSSSADGPDRDTPSGSPGCTAESLPIEFGEPADGNDPDSPLRFDFGPATAECSLSGPTEFAFLDADEAVIGSPSVYAGGNDAATAEVDVDRRVSVELSIGAADDVEAESCDPVVPVYLGHRFPDEAEYYLAELGGDGWKACASEEQELLEVGPYRIQ